MYIIGAILVLVGVVSLLENLGFLPVGFWEFFWPALLILVGVLLLSRSRCKECSGKVWCTCQKKKTAVAEK